MQKGTGDSWDAFVGAVLSQSSRGDYRDEISSYRAQTELGGRRFYNGGRRQLLCGLSFGRMLFGGEFLFLREGQCVRQLPV